MKEFDIEKFPTSEAAKRMISYVSEAFYEKSYVGKWLYQVMGQEWDTVQKILEEELPKQFFPETATWGLMYHEMKWGLPVRNNLSYEERRMLIYQKRDCIAPMTPYRMERYLESKTGCQVYITDTNDPGRFGYVFDHPNLFKVTIIGDSDLNLNDVKNELDKMKQSHTAYTIDLLSGRYETTHCTYTAVVPQTKKIYEMEVL